MEKDRSALENVRRMARVCRAARKVRGYTQTRLATGLGLCQAKISKFEKGIQSINAEEWYSICSILNIDSETAYWRGYIDQCTWVRPVDSYPHSSFKIPKKYKRHAFSKVRTGIPFIKYFIHVFGYEKFEEYLKRLKIDPDLLIVLDKQISIRFILDLVEDLIGKKLLNNETQIRNLAHSVADPDSHGCLRKVYDGKKSRRSLLKLLVGRVGLYEENFRYEIEDEKKDLVVLSCSPGLVMESLPTISQEVGSALHFYKKHYFSYFSSYGGFNTPARVVSLANQFKGDDRCLYKIQF